MRRRRALSTTAIILAAAIPLAAAGSAAADSIVYIKDHNVWIAKPDGSAARAVTTDGKADWPYRSPSQADNGTISAGRGTDIVQLDQQGNQLAAFERKLPPNSASFAAAHPQDVAVTADGSRVAYTLYGYSCLPGASCGTRQVTFYSSADGKQDYGYEFSLTAPEWVSNDLVLGFGGYGKSVMFDRPNSGDYDARTWFNDPADIDLGDGELSRQGDRLAALRSYGDDYHLVIYRVGNATTAPKEACSTGAEPTLEDPSWSPDGRRIAFAHKDGIEVLPLPNVVDGDCPGAASGTVVLPGGTQPDWSAAEVQPRYEISADIVSGTNLARALKKGLKLWVETNVAGTLGGSIKVADRKVGSGSAQLEPGRGTITFRFTKRARRSFAKKRKLAIYVDASFHPRSGHAFPVTGTLKVKR